MAMGMSPVIWTTAGGKSFDTQVSTRSNEVLIAQDWEVAAGAVTAQTVVNNVKTMISNAQSMPQGFISLQHDLYQQVRLLGSQH